MGRANVPQSGTDLPPAGDLCFRAFGSVIVFITVLLLLFALIVFWRIPSQSVVNLMPDDAFYYFGISRNFVKGHGFSFDTINPTNGFQPLWMYLLLPVAYLTRDMSVEVFPRAAFFYQALLLVLAVGLLHFALRRWCSASVLLFSDAIILLLGMRLFFNGMETPVVFLSFALTVWCLSRGGAESHDVTYFAMVGMLSALILLARLDSVFIVLIWIAVHFMQRERAWSYLGITVAVLAVLVAPYLLYNLWAFGDWMPISGRLKNSFPHIEQIDWRRVPVQHYVPLLVCPLATGWLWRRKHQQVPLLLFLMAWSAGSWLHAVHTILFMKWGVFKWHFSPYWIPLTVIVPVALHELQLHGLARASCAAGVILWAASVLSIAQFIHETLLTSGPPAWATVAYRAAVWARENTSGDAVFAMKDAGRFGYYSERRVINLDGLVNNMELQQYLRARRLSEYFRKKGVGFLAQHAISPRSTMVDNAPAVAEGSYSQTHISYLSRLYNIQSDAIPLFRKYERFRERHRDGVFLIWEIKSPQVASVSAR
ncbi:MAG: hypothetical protein RMM08_04405 [Armatimonadota bacterium]|nr:hypothetical protein [Armatimonadota bacterium]